MIVQCPQCGSSVPSENVNMQQMMAMCPQCNHFFKPGVYSETPKAKPRKLKQPDEIQVEEGGDYLVLTMRHVYSYGEMQLLRIRPLWFVAALSIFLISLIFPISVDFYFFLVVGFLAVMGFILLYTSIALGGNVAQIVIDREQLSISFGPLPFPRVRVEKLETSAITKFSIVRNTALAGGSFHHLMAETDNGKDVLLFKDMPKMYMEYIGEQLETFIQREGEQQ